MNLLALKDASKKCVKISYYLKALSNIVTIGCVFCYMGHVINNKNLIIR